MKYTRTQFTKEYYGLWELGLLLPNPNPSRLFSVKYKKNEFDEYSRVTLKALSINDALERACYAITYASPWRPEDIDLHAVYDEEENLLWVDEPFYNTIQKENEFRGMERREFLALFGATSAAILFGFKPVRAMAGTTTTGLSGTATGFLPTGEQLYTTAGSFTWTVPTSVTTVSAVCVGGGGSGMPRSYYQPGGAGGGLGWKNNISTTPTSNISIIVGVGGNSSDGGTSSFGSIFSATGGAIGSDLAPTPRVVAGGSPVSADGGGSGGNASWKGSGYGYNGGGGSGGYSGNGGNSVDYDDTYGYAGFAGTGGGGGGGSILTGNGGGHGGGGVGLYGQGSNGSAGGTGTSGGNPGGGGSGGSAGVASVSGGQAGNGGLYGGGGGGHYATGNTNAYGRGGNGAVRIIWGIGRSFPSNAS